MTEIQELTEPHAWCYMDTARNVADDITRGKTQRQLVEPNRWSQGPPFLLQAPAKWPVKQTASAEEEVSKLRKSTFCGVTSTVAEPQVLDVDNI